MRTLVEASHTLPLVDVEICIPSGCALDPTGKEGLAKHSVGLARRGAGGRDRAQLDEALDDLGATLDAAAAPDFVTFSGRCMTKNLEPLLGLLGDVICRPTLDEPEHEKLRRESIATIDDIRDDDASLATRWFDRLAMAGHPYGRSGHGTEASLTALGRDDVAAWHKRWIVKDELIVGFAGDVDATRAETMAREVFASLPARAPGGGTPIEPARAPITTGRRTILVDKPERTQSNVLIGHPAPPGAHPDVIALQAASTIFGGPFTSRLMNEVRVKRGWSYSVTFRVVRARLGHTVRMRVYPAAEQTADTLALVLDMYEQLVDGGVTAAELAFVQSYLSGAIAFDLDTPSKRLDQHLDELLLGLPPGTNARFAERLNALTVDDVNDAIRRWFRPADATILVTCTADDLRPALERIPGGKLGELEVVPFDAY